MRPVGGLWPSGPRPAWPGLPGRGAPAGAAASVDTEAFGGTSSEGRGWAGRSVASSPGEGAGASSTGGSAGWEGTSCPGSPPCSPWAEEPSLPAAPSGADSSRGPGCGAAGCSGAGESACELVGDQPRSSPGVVPWAAAGLAVAIPSSSVPATVRRIAGAPRRATARRRAWPRQLETTSSSRVAARASRPEATCQAPASVRTAQDSTPSQARQIGPQGSWGTVSSVWVPPTVTVARTTVRRKASAVIADRRIRSDMVTSGNRL